MIREATAMTVRQNLGTLLNEIQYRQDQVVITKGGKPVAAMVEIALFDKIRAMHEEFERLSAELAQSYRDAPPGTVEAEVDEAVASVRGR